jgi:hypothetical protein
MPHTESNSKGYGYIHKIADNQRIRRNEIMVANSNGSCNTCKCRDSMYCKLKKKFLRTVHQYYRFWEINSNVIS